jgi:hypothetical protein
MRSRIVSATAPIRYAIPIKLQRSAFGFWAIHSATSSAESVPLSDHGRGEHLHSVELAR